MASSSFSGIGTPRKYRAMSKKLSIILLTIGIIILGFIRGYLFGNINWIYKTLTVNRPNAARHEFYFLLEWDPSSIVILKWILTLLFFFLFGLFTYLIVSVIFKNKLYNKIVIFMYLGMFAISTALYLVGLLFNSSMEFYHLVRTVMGISQSFMPLMILVIIIKFLPQASTK